MVNSSIYIFKQTIFKVFLRPNNSLGCSVNIHKFLHQSVNTGTQPMIYGLYMDRSKMNVFSNQQRNEKCNP